MKKLVLYLRGKGGSPEESGEQSATRGIARRGGARLSRKIKVNAD